MCRVTLSTVPTRPDRRSRWVWLSAHGSGERRMTRFVWRVAVPVACACAGLLATTSMINARGTDLRGGRHSDLTGIVADQSDRVTQLRGDAAAVQADID